MGAGIQVRLCLAALLLGCPLALDAQSLPNLTVVGQGEASMRPDFVELSFTVQATGASAERAKADVDARTARVLDVLEAHAIDDADKTFSGLLVSQNYISDRNGNETPGDYDVARSFDIKLRKFDEYELLVGGLVEAGIDGIASAESGLDEPAALTHAALKAAAADARLRAEAIAEGLGATLGSPIEVGQDRLYPQEEFQLNIAGGSRFEEIIVTGSRIGRPPPLEFVPGDIEATGTVVVRFAIER